MSHHDSQDLAGLLAAAIGRTAEGKQVTYPSTRAWMARLGTSELKNTHPVKDQADTSTSDPKAAAASSSMASSGMASSGMTL